MNEPIDLTEDDVYDYVMAIVGGYRVYKEIIFYSRRYEKWIRCEPNDWSDGATSALDIRSFGWIIHDDLCRTGKFEDGSTCTNWQASQVLSDILKAEGRWFRCRSWFWATWLFGGGEARKNGMC